MLTAAEKMAIDQEDNLNVELNEFFLDLPKGARTEPPPLPLLSLKTASTPYNPPYVLSVDNPPYVLSGEW